MTINDSPYKPIIRDHFDCSLDFDFLDIVADALDNLDDNYPTNVCIETREYIEQLDTDSLWKIMMFYQSPIEANFQEASDRFVEDVLSIVRKASQKEQEEE